MKRRVFNSIQGFSSHPGLNESVVSQQLASIKQSTLYKVIKHYLTNVNIDFTHSFRKRTEDLCPSDGKD